MSVLEPKMLDDNCLMSLRQKDKEGMRMRQDKADAEPNRGKKWIYCLDKKGQNRHGGERAHEVRTGPIDFIRRVGKRLVRIPQQGRCIRKVAVFVEGRK